MAKFTLPTNAKISQGKTWPMPQGTYARSFKIYRCNQDNGKNQQTNNCHPKARVY